MSILQVITIYLLGILTGGLIFKIISKYVEESKIEKQTKKLNSQFKQILSNISNSFNADSISSSSIMLCVFL